MFVAAGAPSHERSVTHSPGHLRAWTRKVVWGDRIGPSDHGGDHRCRGKAYGPIGGWQPRTSGIEEDRTPLACPGAGLGGTRGTGGRARANRRAGPWEARTAPHLFETVRLGELSVNQWVGLFERVSSAFGRRTLESPHNRAVSSFRLGARVSAPSSMGPERNANGERRALGALALSVDGMSSDERVGFEAVSVRHGSARVPGWRE